MAFQALTAIVLMALALLIRLVIAPVGAGLQYVTFFPAVTVAAAFAGYRAGLLATVIGVFLATYVFTPPHYSFSLEVLGKSFWSNMVFLFDGIIVSLLIETLHRYRRKSALELEESSEIRKELDSSNKRFARILDNLFAYVALLDTNGVILEVNKASLGRAGYRRTDVVGQYFHDAPWWSYDKTVQAQLIAAIEAAKHGQTSRYDVAVRMGDDLVPIDFQLSPIHDENGEIVGLLPTGVEITERVRAEAELRLAAIAFESQEGMVVTDTRNVIVRVNRAFTEITGYTAEEAIGRRMSILKSGRHDKRFYAGMWKGILSEGSWRGEIWNRNKNGEIHPHWLIITAVKGTDGVTTNYLGSYTDITERVQADGRINQLLEEQKLIFDNAHVGITMLRRRQIVKCNQRLAEMFGYAAPDEIEGKLTEIFYASPEDFDEIGDSLYYRRAQSGVAQGEVEMRRRDGSRIWVMLTGRPLDPTAVRDGSIWVYADITDRKRAEAELRIAAATFDSQEAIVVTDADSVILRVNRAFTAITGYAPEEVVGQNPRVLKSGRHDADFYRKMWESINLTGAWQGEIWDRRKNGQEYPKWLAISAVKDDNGKVTHYIGAHYDITERKEAEEKIEALAFFDQLTGLPNRFSLNERLAQALGLAGRNEKQLAVMLIDLDNFKTINDTLGHQTGDSLLRQVGQRLTDAVRQSDLVARLGGDEFIVVLPDIDSPTDAANVADKILKAVSDPYQIAGQELRTSPSIGICIYPDDATESHDLFKKADVAMYHAKSRGRGNYQFFKEEIQAAAIRRLAIEADLRQALTGQQFVLHYQPQIDLRTGSLVGVEALIRWQHPQRGLVFPDDFVPIAEDTGLILPIGDWVLQEACRQLSQWRSCGLNHIRVSVNLSASQFLDPNLPDRINALLRQYGLDADALDLEVTESMTMASPADTIGSMNVLRDNGLTLSIDDFGTGYSSLAYLKMGYMHSEVGNQ